MTQVIALLPRIQAACEAVAERLVRGPADRNVLMDMATMLTLVAYVLDRAEEDVVGYALTAQPLCAGSALNDLHESARWLRDQAAGASEKEVLDHLRLALHHATDALAILRHTDGP